MIMQNNIPNLFARHKRDLSGVCDAHLKEFSFGDIRVVCLAWLDEIQWIWWGYRIWWKNVKWMLHNKLYDQLYYEKVKYPSRGKLFMKSSSFIIINSQQWLIFKISLSQTIHLYLITSSHIFFSAIDVNAIGNIRRLLFDSNQKVQCSPIESWCKDYLQRI